MQGKVCLITGGTAGIGQVAANALARQGAQVIIVGRSPQRCAEVAAAIRMESGSAQVDYLAADLSSQEQIRRLAAEFAKRWERLDVLINNAGAFFMRREESPDGIEMTFALNHLNYFLLTDLLLDALKASAPARIVNVSSDAHRGGRIAFDDPQFRKKYSGWAAYAQSKLANVIFTYELARRLEGSGVSANALHPGFVATNFAKNNGGIYRAAMSVIHLFARSPEQGARTSIYLASSPQVEGISGKYYTDERAVDSAPASYDRETALRLWRVSAEMTGIPAGAQYG
jgi:NAD(P)-dependent dehydrogenase (short-subunit alcohol dehydrogenase family)